MLVSVSPTRYYAGHFKQGVISIILGSYEISSYMYFLSACNRGLFKSYDCYVLFLPFEEPHKYYEKCF